MITFISFRCSNNCERSLFYGENRKIEIEIETNFYLNDLLDEGRSTVFRRVFHRSGNFPTVFDRLVVVELFLFQVGMFFFHCFFFIDRFVRRTGFHSSEDLLENVRRRSSFAFCSLLARCSSRETNRDDWERLCVLYQREFEDFLVHLRYVLRRNRSPSFVKRREMKKSLSTSCFTSVNPFDRQVSMKQPLLLPHDKSRCHWARRQRDLPFNKNPFYVQNKTKTTVQLWNVHGFEKQTKNEEKKPMRNNIQKPKENQTIAMTTGDNHTFDSSSSFIHRSKMEKTLTWSGNCARIHLRLDKRIDTDHWFESFHLDLDADHKEFGRCRCIVLHSIVSFRCSRRWNNPFDRFRH